MSFFRNTVFVAAFVLAGAVQATDVSMAGGSVSFSTPDQWVGIMETQGDPEVRVFQVPDSSPTGSNSLARVTVTVKQVADVAAFQQYVSGAMSKAKSLTGYQAATSQGADNFVYTAQENGAPYSYSERYWFKDNHAIQLRCVRPSQSQAGAQWKAAFDKGCDAIAGQLK
ncbi:hypothetical protein [Dyella jiangningensis]|uniref:Uncharacterized protein n=1 Tax=Dyella jiangningensis TaxID=1379159 RepID=A0A328NZ22_9GAMM|nr:hypothetical protein [Dyella jiangningensis]RAO75338.1 hypothetical protein CA260_14735 [Dyella jiangningensis]